MIGPLQSVYKSLSSRLSRRIVAWVFLSIVTIELVILLPSYRLRQRTLLRDLEETSTKVLLAVKVNSMTGMEPSLLLDYFQNISVDDLSIVGAVLYSMDGRVIDQYGEQPTLDPQSVNTNILLRYGMIEGDRYDVLWSPEQTESDYTLIVRYDISAIQVQLFWYVLRILGLVVLISGFVTLVAFIGLERILITPVLHLRDDLMVAGEAVSQEDMPDFKSLKLIRQDELGEVTVAFRNMFKRIHSEIRHRKQVETELKAEHTKSDQLLRNMLPAAIAQELKHHQGAIAHRIDNATILFADIVNFTGFAAQVSPIRLVDILNRIFSEFDRLAEHHKLEKIKTIGDAYMVVGGVIDPGENPARCVVEMALDMQLVIRQFKQQNGDVFQLRIGINTGPVVAGVIGLKKYSYDLWGDAVNIASRMESHGEVGKIHLSAATYEQVKGLYAVEPRGEIAVKGRGMMKTYFLLGRIPNAEAGYSHAAHDLARRAIADSG
ncbi:MAG: adenylate/guanylate cyclase domain-containing protein [Cyanothece sp. SIO2G6]|nr:adenylate/guanylate cyclase domain-containing protein [Cyanothece sp. SIO2G6]